MATTDRAPDSPGRRGRPGYDQDTVLRRAIDLFNRQGYDATSVGDLARELGLSKSAIYHHVESKESLLAAALDEALVHLEAAIEAAETAEMSALDRLRLAITSSVRVLTDHLPAVTLLLRVRGNGPVERDALARRRALDERLAELVRAAATEGSLREGVSPELASRLVFGAVNSLVEWYRPGGSVDPDDLAESLSALVLDGLLPR